MKYCADTNISSYLHDLFIWSQTQRIRNIDPPLPIVNICSVHILRAVTRKLHCLTDVIEIRKVEKMFLTKLIHSSDLQQADVIFHDLITVFGSKNYSEHVNNALIKLKKMAAFDLEAESDFQNKDDGEETIHQQINQSHPVTISSRNFR